MERIRNTQGQDHNRGRSPNSLWLVTPGRGHLRLAAMVLLGSLLLATSPVAAQTSADSTYEQAFADYRAGNYGAAVPALETAAAQDHPGAQALLAQLLWRSDHISKDEPRALGLAIMALENAAPEQRLWIADIHQGIFCAASPATRQVANRIVSAWQSTHSRRAGPVDHSEEDGIGMRRACATGEVIGKSGGE
jgi:hypothetical protein